MMQISARNQLPGMVKQIQRGSVNSVVQIELSEPAILTAVITNNAVDELDLEPGGRAIAVIKASNVLIGVNKGE
jgi:molybdopterin-binding protein